MSKAIDFFNKGYNCSESIIKAVNEEKNTKIPVAIGTPFGRGISVGQTCGAITGAIMALGAIKGRNLPNEKNNVRKDTKEIMNKIKEKYGTFNCIELKKKGVSCKEIIEYSYDILNKYI